MQTITITKESPFLIRLFMKCYIWVWNPNLTTLTNCRIVWGTIFFPLAFISYKREFRFIPRMSILAMAVSLSLFAIGWWQHVAEIALFCAIIWVPLFFLLEFIESKIMKKIVTVSKIDENDENELLEEYPRLDKVLDKIMSSRAGDIIHRFVWWIIDVKERKCSFVRVEL